MLHIRLPSVLKALRRRKALILVDTPPVLPVSDARLVAPLADGVILLATAGTQKPASFQAALDRLALVDSKLLGMILNKAGAGRRGRRQLLPLRGDGGDGRAAQGGARSKRSGGPPPPRASRSPDPGRSTPAGRGRPRHRWSRSRWPGGCSTAARPSWRGRPSPSRSATSARCGRCTPSRGSAWASSSCCAVTRVETLLLALAAVLPWEGALAYPTESVSVVKILGVLLFGAWLLRALARSEPLRVSPALAWAGFFGLAVGLSLLFAPDPPTAWSTGCATRCSSCSSSSSCSSRTRSRTSAGSSASSSLVHAGRGVGHLRVRRARTSSAPPGRSRIRTTSPT